MLTGTAALVRTRLEALIKSGNELLKLPTHGDSHHDWARYFDDKTPPEQWRMSAHNLLESYLPGVHLDRFVVIMKDYGNHQPYLIKRAIAVLQSLLEEIDLGLIGNIKLRLQAELSDTVIDRARGLLRDGHADCAAVLGRVVLEEALRAVAREQTECDHGAAIGKVNDCLKDADVYNKPQWRQIQSWLDVGHSAAHGQAHKLSDEQVSGMLNGVEGFLAQALSR